MSDVRNFDMTKRYFQEVALPYGTSCVFVVEHNLVVDGQTVLRAKCYEKGPYTLTVTRGIDSTDPMFTISRSTEVPQGSDEEWLDLDLIHNDNDNEVLDVIPRYPSSASDRRVASGRVIDTVWVFRMIVEMEKQHGGM